MGTGFVKGFFHAGVTVKDLERSLDFYCNVLGLEFVSRKDVTDEYVFRVVNVDAEMIKVALLKVPGSDAHVELLEYVGVERHPGTVRPCDWGTGHFCLYVDDLDSCYRELKAKGMNFRSKEPVVATGGMNKGSKIIYGFDPDGYIIELIEPAKR